MINVKNFSTALFFSTLLSGCANVAIPDVENFNEQQIIRPEMDRLEKNEPALTKIKTEAFIIQRPDSLPNFIREKEVNLTFSKDYTISDFTIALNIMGINIIIAETKKTDLGAKKISVRNYNGKLGDLLDVISSLYNISFNYESGGILTIDEQSTYIINILQNEDIISDLKNTIERLGAEELEYSLIGGNLTYRASPKSHEKIKNYIDAYSKNVAVIGLQVSVVTVQLDKKSNKGFDWSALNVIAGEKSLFTSDIVSSGLGLAVNSAGITAKIVNNDFNFSSVINYLSTYGKTEAQQSTMMKTISGKEVSLKSTQSIPYVKEVELTVSDNSNSSSSQGITTDKVDVGLTLAITPYFDSNTNMVTVNLKLDLSSLLSMTEITSGDTKITQPSTQTQTFTNLMKLKTGDSSVIGGIMYDTISDNRTGVSYLEDMDIASQNKQYTKNAVFIILRPNVTIFGNFEKEKEIIQKIITEEVVN